LNISEKVYIFFRDFNDYLQSWVITENRNNESFRKLYKRKRGICNMDGVEGVLGNEVVNKSVEAVDSVLINYIYKGVVAVVILIVGFALGLIVKKILFKVLHEIELNHLAKKLGVYYNVEKGFSVLASYFIYFLTLLFFFNSLGITSLVVIVIVGAIILLIVVGFLLGLKDVIPNFISGFILYRKNFLRIGKTIKVDNIEGVIEKFNFTETEIKTEAGDKIYLPNYLLVKKKVWLEKK
jgi:small-conductance mechanosensitive channel